MSNKHKSYWFILDNYVHISVKNGEVMFYNPLNGKILEYSGSSAEPVIKLVKQSRSPKNLLVIRLTEKELSQPDVYRFVGDMRTFFMGDLIDSSLTGGKPVQMMPHPKIHRDVDKMKKTPSRTVGEQMMKYLVEISIYINNTCSLDCNICSSAYKQFLCCTCAGNRKRELDIPMVEDMFRQLKGAPLDRVNVLGGDIFKYAGLDHLVDILNIPGQTFEKNFYIHYANLPGQESKLALFRPPGSLKVPVTFPVDKELFRQAMEMLEKHGITAEFLFIVAGEEDVAGSEELIVKYKPGNYSFQPFFNGLNLSFFEQNVFLDREDLEEAKPGLKEIFARQLVNPLHFGTLTVLSNGSVYANVNTQRLGSLNGGSLHDVVYKEMYRGKSWRRIRKKVEPCKGCTFEALCPPLSNYEYALGRNNLCHIR